MAYKNSKKGIGKAVSTINPNKSFVKSRANCAVCIAIKDNPILRSKIYKTSYYDPRNQLSLAELHRLYSGEDGTSPLFSYKALTNHVKRHQFQGKEDFSRNALEKIAVKAAIDESKKLTSEEVWDKVIDVALGKLQSGEMTLSANHLLKANKDKTDFQLKKTDQQLAFQEMVWFYTSGENNEARAYDRHLIEGEAATDYDPTLGFAEGPGEGADGPSVVHNQALRDALAPGTGSLPERNDQTQDQN